jgi:hypothetical protein
VKQPLWLKFVVSNQHKQCGLTQCPGMAMLCTAPVTTVSTKSACLLWITAPAVNTEQYLLSPATAKRTNGMQRTGGSYSPHTSLHSPVAQWYALTGTQSKQRYVHTLIPCRSQSGLKACVLCSAAYTRMEMPNEQHTNMWELCSPNNTQHTHVHPAKAELQYTVCTSTHTSCAEPALVLWAIRTTHNNMNRCNHPCAGCNKQLCSACNHASLHNQTHTCVHIHNL